MNDFLVMAHSYGIVLSFSKITCRCIHEIIFNYGMKRNNTYCSYASDWKHEASSQLLKPFCSALNDASNSYGTKPTRAVVQDSGRITIIGQLTFEKQRDKIIHN